MAGLGTYALAEIEEVKRWLDISGNLKDGLLELIINGSSGLVESKLDRQIITRGALTEYHPINPSVWIGPELYLNQYPIISVTSVHEDSARTYADTEKLTDGTDFIVVKPDGKLTRIAGATSGRSSWLNSYHAVKVVYSAGYADRAGVPEALKDVVCRHSASVYHEIIKHLPEVSNINEAAGSFARFGPAMLTSAMIRDLAPFRRPESIVTGEVLT